MKDPLDDFVRNYLLAPGGRYLLAWGVALGTVAVVILSAWTTFAAPARRDGNFGHTTVDFGGQWLMGRMIVEGHGRRLYRRNVQRQVLRDHYPRADEVPPEKREPDKQDKHDAEELFQTLMGNDAEAARRLASCCTPWAATHPWEGVTLAAAGLSSWDRDVLRDAALGGVGGPLYPPVHAVLFAPLGALPPAAAYRVNQFASLILAVLIALGLRDLSRGAVWWPVAFTLVLVYPGHAGSINLGQNAVPTLAILVGGWVLVAHDRPGWAGVVWGLLAFKPVWAAALFLVPLLSGRRRACLTMLGTGVALAAATLPVVGVQSWLDWFQVGRAAAWLYNADENWVFLSRDLLSIPRRWMLDFTLPLEVRDNLPATVASWLLYGSVVCVTVAVPLARPARRRDVTGPAAAFLFLGAWLSCFHFMYYDVLLTALPVALLLVEPRHWLRQRFVALSAPRAGDAGVDLRPYALPGVKNASPDAGSNAPPWVWVVNSFPLTLLVLLLGIEHVLPQVKGEVGLSASWLKYVGTVPESAWSSSRLVIPQPVKFGTSVIGPPWNTFCLILLWLWCGRRWWRDPADTDRGLSADAAQLVERGAGVGGPHQGLADQDRLDAGRG